MTWNGIPMVVDPMVDIKTMMVKMSDAYGAQPQTLIVHPKTYARLQKQLAYMETRRYRIKRWFRIRRRRLVLKFWRRVCRHPARKLTTDEDGSYCTRCKQIDVIPGTNLY